MEKEYLFENLFLGTGAMKTGTTWLYALLVHHPDIHFTPEKEIHYYAHVYTNETPLTPAARLNRVKGFVNAIDPNVQNIDNVRLRLQWTANYLSEPVDDLWFKNLFMLQRQKKYATDFSNLTCHLDARGWTRVIAQVRNLKVLYIMRHPVDRLWSHVKFHLQVSGQKDNLENWGPKDYRKFARSPFIWKNARYGDIVTTLKNNLSDEQVKICFFEDIHQDQRQWLKDLEDFLGVRHIDYPDVRLNTKVNETEKLPMPDFFPKIFEKLISGQVAKLEQAGLEIPDSWKQMDIPMPDENIASSI